MQKPARSAKVRRRSRSARAALFARGAALGDPAASRLAAGAEEAVLREALVFLKDAAGAGGAVLREAPDASAGGDLAAAPAILIARYLQTGLRAGLEPLLRHLSEPRPGRPDGRGGAAAGGGAVPRKRAAATDPASRGGGGSSPVPGEDVCACAWFLLVSGLIDESRLREAVEAFRAGVGAGPAREVYAAVAASALALRLICAGGDAEGHASAGAPGGDCGSCGGGAREAFAILKMLGRPSLEPPAGPAPGAALRLAEPPFPAGTGAPAAQPGRPLPCSPGKPPAGRPPGLRPVFTLVSTRRPAGDGDCREAAGDSRRNPSDGCGGSPSFSPSPPTPGLSLDLPRRLLDAARARDAGELAARAFAGVILCAALEGDFATASRAAAFCLGQGCVEGGGPGAGPVARARLYAEALRDTGASAGWLAGLASPAPEERTRLAARTLASMIRGDVDAGRVVRAEGRFTELWALEDPEGWDPGLHFVKARAACMLTEIYTERLMFDQLQNIFKVADALENSRDVVAEKFRASVRIVSAYAAAGELGPALSLYQPMEYLEG
ncbi:MAG: hypothetical protein LBG06_03280, partial [Deltaproteobacteria bacterium]|nr:hypothetical protein [Deltaproteobacteria bacterium]